MKFYSASEEPQKVVTRAPKRYLRFDIEKVEGEYHYYEVELPVFKWDYSHLVSAIIRAKYSQDEVEAILLNKGKTTADNQRYEELQAWRAHAKEVVSSTGIVMDEELKPTEEQLLQDRLNAINAETDYKILCGYKYDGQVVWLSTENQFNYKAAYDLAVQTKGASLPVTFKLGTDENPCYRQFDNLEDFSKFYIGAMTWIQQCLAVGWEKKAKVTSK